jgi:hypothetical protein
LVAVSGFILWTASGISSIFKIFDDKKDGSATLKIKSARFPLVLFAAGYVLWLTGMALA